MEELQLSSITFVSLCNIMIINSLFPSIFESKSLYKIISLYIYPFLAIHVTVFIGGSSGLRLTVVLIGAVTIGCILFFLYVLPNSISKYKLFV